MATHSSVLAWRIPGTGEADGLPSMGSHRVGHDWSDLAAAMSDLKCNLEKIPFTSPSKRIKLLELILSKEVRVYSVNYKTFWKKLKKI